MKLQLVKPVEKENLIYLSPRTAADSRFAFAFERSDQDEQIPLTIVVDAWCPDGQGYVFIDGKYFGCFSL